MNEYFIPFNTPSLKNSKVKTNRGIFASKTVKKYLRALGIVSYSSRKKEVIEYKLSENLFLKALENLNIKEYPVIIGFHFVRDSKRDFDFNNASQIILDLLTAHKIIEDDSMRFVIPIPYEKEGVWYKIDKNNAGVYLTFKTKNYGYL